MTATMTRTVTGTPVNRVDGVDKVSGAALYSAEITLPHMTHAALVGATVPSGRVTGFDVTDALNASGVLAVLSHTNLPKIASPPVLLPSLVGQPAPGQSFFPMQDETIHYWGQPVAIVVADTHERAQHAASLVRVSYERYPSVSTIEQGRAQAYEAQRLFGGLAPGRMERGDVDAALASAPVRIDITCQF